MSEHDPRREALSAMADGEAASHEVDAMIASWRDDPATRQRWHAYHLIGDALRSDDLAAPVARDEAFVQAVRARLQAQPVVLAPAVPAVGMASRRWMRWAAPAAVAAGFVAVAGVLVVTRTAAPEAQAPLLAQRGAAASGAMLVTSPAPAAATSGMAMPGSLAAPEVTPMTGRVIRDAKLDRYLSAHKGAAEGAALLVPGGAVRRVDILVGAPGQ